MRHAPVLLLLTLSACEGPDCEFSEGTGLFEIYKTEGCIAVETSIDPKLGSAISLSHAANTVLVNGLDNINLFLAGHLYVGREGQCFMSDADAAQVVSLQGHCDYRVRDFAKVSDTESRMTVDLLDGYMEAYGNKGTFKATLRVTAYDQGFSP